MTTVELSDDIMRQLELINGAPTDNVYSKELDFDAKGTVHVMYRDADDKLLHDTPMKEVKIEESYNEAAQLDFNKYKENVIKHRKRTTFAIVFLSVMLASLVACAIVTMMLIK